MTLRLRRYSIPRAKWPTKAVDDTFVGDVPVDDGFCEPDVSSVRASRRDLASSGG